MRIETWNWIAAVIHAASAIGIGIYFLVEKGTVNFNTDLYTYDLNLNADDPAASEVTAKKSVTITGTLLKILVVVYFAFTAFFHVLYATDCFGTGAYSRALGARNNYFRWIEYAISSTIMTFLLAIICGVKDVNTVILLVVMNVGMILCGQIVEAASGPNAKNIKIIATLIGWILLAGIALVLLLAFFSGLADGKRNDFKVPTWVYFLIFPLLIWYASFGVVALLAAFNSKQTATQYLKYEKAYIILSLISKINLGYVVAFGLTRPKAEKNDA